MGWLRIKEIKMINHHSPLLNTLIGKTIKEVFVSTSHGEVLTIYFTDNTYINICSTFSLEDTSIIPDEHDIFVDVNGEVI